MAKRGRKPKTDRKGYFYEQEEQAFKDFINADTKEEKDKIFEAYLRPAFTIMIESIIRRYNLYPPDEEFKDTFDDTISFLLTKINNFKPDSGYKAYSYCGTICKNYLIYKINQFAKNQKRNLSYDQCQVDIDDNVKYSYDTSSSELQTLHEIINKTASSIDKIINDKEKLKLSENEIKVGKALCELLTNWEELFTMLGSNKFNKSSILLFLKEATLLNTKEIRDSMKKYKAKYYEIKKNVIENIYD